MTDKKKGKFNLPKAAKNYQDSYYKYKTPQDAQGNPVNSLKLGEHEKEWLDQFEKEYYGNTGRYGELFKGNKEAIKEIDDATNARNRDIFTKNYHVSVRSNDITRFIYNGYDSFVNESVRLKGLKATINNLVTDCALDIQQIHEDNSIYQVQIDMIKEEVRKVSANIVKALKIEQKIRKEEKRSRS